MKKQHILLAVIAAALLLLAGGAVGALAVYSPAFLWLAVGLWLCAAATVTLVLVLFRGRMTKRLRQLVNRLDPHQQQVLQRFPLPTLLVSETGEILYYNDLFNTQVLDGTDSAVGVQLDTVFPDFTVQELSRRSTMDVQRAAHKLTAYISVDDDDDSRRYVLYLADNTALKNVAAEYTASRPVVLHFCIDNLEEATQRLRDGDRARITGQVETVLDDWITGYDGILQKYGTDRFIAVAENRHLSEMTKDRFAILDQIRTAFPETEGGITLSIGVGQGKTLGECRQMARQALEMALSRGGDQAAIKTMNGYDFYGGQSRGVERRTKVRTRMVANSLRDLILSSEQVMIMGHRLSDLDCLGSGAALAVTARSLGVPAYVVVRRSHTMAGQLIRRYEEAGQLDLFLDPEDAVEKVSKEMLLIITDTHTVPMLDAPDFYDMAQRVVVIDHHRRMVDYIKDAVLTYHEPSSSSACELVSELLPYLVAHKPGRLEAEALLSGIMLDTRNFVLRTGVRTFEAAAYLRGLGADTVAVKKMFSESLDMYQLKNDLVAQAQIYNGTAITVTKEDLSSRRAAAAQAADDLLSVQGVRASFVLCPMGQEINISARSFGEINVQLIMERLGGGGHHTMAATQLAGATPAQAETMLRDAIDAYQKQQA